jgi:hypothetical protein
MNAVHSADELLQPGEVALVIKDSHSFVVNADGSGETADWRLGPRAEQVDWIIVYHPDGASGASLWMGKFEARLGGRKKRLRLKGLRPAGHTDQKFFAFIRRERGTYGYGYVEKP